MVDTDILTSEKHEDKQRKDKAKNNKHSSAIPTDWFQIVCRTDQLNTTLQTDKFDTVLWTDWFHTVLWRF